MWSFVRRTRWYASISSTTKTSGTVSANPFHSKTTHMFSAYSFQIVRFIYPASREPITDPRVIFYRTRIRYYTIKCTLWTGRICTPGYFVERRTFRNYYYKVAYSVPPVIIRTSAPPITSTRTTRGRFNWNENIKNCPVFDLERRPFGRPYTIKSVVAIVARLFGSFVRLICYFLRAFLFRLMTTTGFWRDDHDDGSTD